jgi:RNA polymerase sigma-70 factor (ECF subfamily)
VTDGIPENPAGGFREGRFAEPSDKILVERTLSGDAEAFTLLHRRYYGRIYRLAFFRLRNASDAEDVTSETFVKAITFLSSYRFQGESLFPWLSRIAGNLITDMGRRQRGITAVSLDSTTTNDIRNLLESLPSNAPDPYQLAIREEVQTLVRDAIQTLPRDQSEAVLLRYLGDLSLREIAQIMGKTEGAVKSLLHRAIVNLRREIGNKTDEAERFAQNRENAQVTEANPTLNTKRSLAQRISQLDLDD